MRNKELAEELHKLIIRKLKKKEKKSILIFYRNIWGSDLSDMRLISKFHIGFRFLLYVIDILVNMHGVFL